MNGFQVKQLQAQWKRLNRRRKQAQKKNEPITTITETMNTINKKLLKLDSSWRNRTINQ